MEMSGQHNAPATTYGKEPWSQLGRRLGGSLCQSVHVGEKSLATSGLKKPDYSAHSPDITLTTPSPFLSVIPKSYKYLVFYNTFRVLFNRRFNHKGTDSALQCTYHNSLMYLTLGRKRFSTDRCYTSINAYLLTSIHS